MDEFVWLTHPDTGGHFNCPPAALDDWLGNGWQVATEPPAERNPVAAEHLAWREQRNQAAAEPTEKPTTKTAARRGTENGEMSDG